MLRLKEKYKHSRSRVTVTFTSGSLNGVEMNRENLANAMFQSQIHGVTITDITVTRFVEEKLTTEPTKVD